MMGYGQARRNHLRQLRRQNLPAATVRRYVFPGRSVGIRPKDRGAAGVHREWLATAERANLARRVT